jgi:S1-C subfamily serine protease
VTILALGAAGDTLGVGSGFIVRPDGVIITNHHVLEGAHRAMLFRSNGEVLDRVTVLDADSLHDLAVLKATAVDLPTLSLARTAPAVGDRVVVIGAPLGLEHTVSDGIVSALRRDGVREQLQMSAPISPGSSGGPVLDVYGRVVGITRATIRAGQALNFAIPARYAAALLSDAQRRAPQSVAAVFGVASSGRTSPAPDGRGGRQPAGAPAPDAGGRLEVPPPSAAREHALTGTFNISQGRPVRHIKIIHGMAPAEDPVLRKKRQKNGQQNISTCQFAKGQQKAKEFFDRYFAGFA